MGADMVASSRPHSWGGTQSCSPPMGFPLNSTYLGECIGYVCGGVGRVEALIAFQNAARDVGVRLVSGGGRRRCWGARWGLSQPGGSSPGVGWVLGAALLSTEHVS